MNNINTINHSITVISQNNFVLWPVVQNHEPENIIDPGGNCLILMIPYLKA